MLKAKNKSDFPIDVVITWVDGRDPNFHRKRNKYLNEIEVKQINKPTRFHEVGELYFVIKSIFKFAPFIRTIHIVTDDQIPEVIDKSKGWSKYYRDKIKVVDHKEIFREYKEVLPSFNILSIESLLYKIIGLAEHFIYFNDDMFLIKPTSPTDWFHNGLPIIRGHWISFSDRLWYKKVVSILFFHKKRRWSFKKAQERAAKIVGYQKKYFRTYHNPRALTKTHFSTFFEREKTHLEQQIKPRFRTNNQFNAYVLSWHYALQKKEAIPSDELHLEEVNFSKINRPEKVLNAIKKANATETTQFLNLQNLELVNTKSLQTIIDMLEQILHIDLTKAP